MTPGSTTPTAYRLEALDLEIAALDRELKQLVASAAPRTVELAGISTGHAGQLLVTAGQNIDRLHGQGSFAMLCGASPIPASFGKTVRHRLNPGGDRQANRALHLVVVARLRYCQRTRAYAERRKREEKSQREIMRCLKRYIAREIYTPLRADLADTHPIHDRQSPPPSCAAARTLASPANALDIYRNVSAIPTRANWNPLP